MYAYSTDEDHYHGSYETPEEAASDGISEEGGRCWVGRCVPPPAPEDSFDIEDLIDRVSSQDLYSGDWADDWIRWTKEQRNEINAAVQKVIGEWLDRHGLRPKFYNIEDAEEWELDGDVPKRASAVRSESK